jgi:hypothetical protein
MTARNVRLGKQPSKLVRDLTLLQNEKCIVEASEGTLTLPIIVDDATRGHFFVGKGQLTLDTIVETPQGAIGKPMNRKFNQPFLMFSETHNISEALSPATNEDFSQSGYEDLADFLVRANLVFSQFFSCSSKGINLRNFEKDSQVFGFFNTHDQWDVLISKDDNLVYASAGKVYISEDLDENSETSSAHVLFGGNGKTVIVGKNNILVDFGEEEK